MPNMHTLHIIWFIYMVQVCFYRCIHKYSSCIDVYLFHRNSSGPYTLYHNGNPIEVYCSFEGDSGYTYISNSSPITSINLSKLYTTKSFAKIRSLLSNGSQKEVTVENINGEDLYFGKQNTMPPYFVIAFSTKRILENNIYVLGYRAADKIFTCNDCNDIHLSSIRLEFYNGPEEINNPQTDDNLQHFTTGLLDQSSVIENSTMVTEFYFHFKMKIEGCFTCQRSINHVFSIKAAIGLPFDIICEPLECCYEDDTGCCTSEDNNCTSEAVYMCKNVDGMYDKISIPCNIETRTCPEPWSVWKDFGECSVTCGEGKQSQTRKRFLPCAKINETVIQNNVCNKIKCPVYKWDYLHSMNLTIEEKKEMMKDELVELKANLTVDKKNTSSAIRQRTSAPDNRPSASSVGYFAILLLVIPLVLIVCLDSIRCFQSKKKFRKKRIRPSQRETVEEQTVTELKTE